jgi:hypothetical protein
MSKKKKQAVNTWNETLTSNVDRNDESLRTPVFFPSLAVMENLPVEKAKVEEAIGLLL